MLFLILLAFTVSLSAQESFDLVVANGTVIDGSGAEGRRADIGIRDGKIAAIGDLSKASAKRKIDAAGLVVAPGFIDMHNHSDDTLLDEPKCESMIRQGVTTMVLGEGARRARYGQEEAEAGAVATAGKTGPGRRWAVTSITSRKRASPLTYAPTSGRLRSGPTSKAST